VAEESRISDKRDAVARHETAMSGTGPQQPDQPIVLVFVSHFFPGYRAGGPPRAIANLIDQVSGVMFKILTADRDMGDSQPYKNVPANKWLEHGGAQVFYTERATLRLRNLCKLIRQTECSALYLNGLFDRLTIRVLLLRWLKLIPVKPVILAPRGVFSRGAINLKRWKKIAYLTVSRLMGLYRGIVWHSTSGSESEDLRAWFRGYINLVDLPDIPRPPAASAPENHVAKLPGKLRIVFLSRISPMKNLLQAVELTSKLNHETLFDIYGPIEDTQYWQACQKLIANAPSNVRIKYCREVRPEEIGRIMGQYDVMLLPTLGENYGHVIVEALASATPVLISENTPWRGLQAQHAGWDLPLSEPASIVACLEQLAMMVEGEHRCWRDGAYKLACAHVCSEDTALGYRNLFSMVSKP